MSQEPAPRTNAQAALQAAATIHAGKAGYTSAQTATNLAFQFKNWLDMHDKRDIERGIGEVRLDTVPNLAEPSIRSTLNSGHPDDDRGVPKPGPRPGPKHFLTEDHNGDPVCHCGWNPAQQPGGWNLLHRENARQWIRDHIAAYKPILPPDGTVPGR